MKLGNAWSEEGIIRLLHLSEEWLRPGEPKRHLALLWQWLWETADSRMTEGESVQHLRWKCKDGFTENVCTKVVRRFYSWLDEQKDGCIDG